MLQTFHLLIDQLFFLSEKQKQMLGASLTHITAYLLQRHVQFPQNLDHLKHFQLVERIKPVSVFPLDLRGKQSDLIIIK